MKVEETAFKDCYIIHDTVYEDERGSFFESFNEQKFKALTQLDVRFVQDNQSTSKKGVLRGLHFQTGDSAQAKLVRVVEGEVLDVVVDIRKGSATFGKWMSVLLSSENKTQFFIPRGFAHGFVVLSDSCKFFYKCDNYYDKAAESGLLYNDTDLAIDWTIAEQDMIINEKDRQNQTFKQLQSSL